MESLLNAGVGLAPLALLTNEAAADLPAAFVRFDQRLRSPDVSDTVREKLLGSTYVLGGLRYAEDRLLEVYMSLNNILEDSTTYQGIMRRGQARGRQDTLLSMARRKFGPPTPQAEAALRAVADLPRLERMAERIFDVTGWDDLLATE